VVEQYLRDVVNGGDWTAARRLVVDEPLLRQLKVFRRAFPDAVAIPNLFLVEDDLVGVNLAGRGTHQGIFQGVPPTGRRWAATCSAFFSVTDGRISDAWVNWDLLGILEQLGAVRRIGTGSA
jgi:predicted ester cyclase